jgi:hypothetical protein
VRGVGREAGGEKRELGGSAMRRSFSLEDGSGRSRGLERSGGKGGRSRRRERKILERAVCEALGLGTRGSGRSREDVLRYGKRAGGRKGGWTARGGVEWVRLDGRDRRVEVSVPSIGENLRIFLPVLLSVLPSVIVPRVVLREGEERLVVVISSASDQTARSTIRGSSSSWRSEKAEVEGELVGRGS